jgi:hypothetical protein
MNKAYVESKSPMPEGSNFKRTPEQKCVAFLFAKNLRDLSETALSIVMSIKNPSIELPSEEVLKICIATMQQSYPNNLFPDGNFVYSRKAVESYQGSELIFDIYDGVKSRLTPEIIKAVNEQDEKYFSKHFDNVFAVLLKNPIIGMHVAKFRFLISNSAIQPKDKSIVWEFFIEIVGLMSQEEKVIQEHFIEKL